MENAILGYKCELCNKYFSQNSSRNRHIKETHLQRNKYHCEQCESRFSKKYNLQVHIQQVHSKNRKQLKCSHFNPVFTKSSSFKKHITDSRGCLESNGSLNVSSEHAKETDAQFVAGSVLKELKQLQLDIQTSIPVTKSFENEPKLANTEKSAVQVTTVKDSLYPQGKFTLLKAQTITGADGLKYFKCEFCGKEFRKTYNFLRHRRIHTKLQPFVCVLCQSTFPTIYQLKSHSSIHTLHEQFGLFHKLYKCPKCEKGFCAVQQFDKHITSSDCEVSIKCPKCFKYFRTLKTLLRHKHTEKDSELEMLKAILPAPLPLSQELQSPQYNISSFECNMCGMQVKEKTVFNHNGKQHECTKCQKLFASKSTVKVHRKSHLSAKNFKCRYCNNCFVTSQSCRRHMESHIKRLLQTNNDKTDTIDFFSTFNTENCKNEPAVITTKTCIIKNTKVFKTKEEVFTSGNLKYKCSECEKSFRYNSWLKKHFKYKHTNELPFKCNCCCREFRTRQTLESHFLTHLTKRSKLTCQVCGRQYASSKSLKLHLRIHTQETPFSCKICNRQFRTSGHLIQHCKSWHKKNP